MGDTSTKSAVPAVKLTLGSISEVETSHGFDMIEVVVDQLADGPSMAYAKLNTHDLEWINQAAIKPKEAMKVSLGYGQGSSEPAEPLFDGEITGWEPQFYGKTPTTLVVRGFNKLHNMSRGRKYRTFQNMKYSDVASKIASEYGLSAGGVMATSSQQPFIVQANATDLDFLRELAERVGYEVGCDVQNNLMFRKPKTNEGPAVTFTWGENLKRFKARFNTAQPIAKIRCGYWDPVDKKAKIGQASDSDVDPMDGGKNAAKHAAKFASAGELFLHNRPCYSQADAEAEAKGLIQQLGLQLIIAEIEGEGDAKAQAGKVVKLDKVGDRFNGKYYIIRARHVLRIDPKLPDFGYVCYLTARRSGANE